MAMFATEMPLKHFISLADFQHNLEEGLFKKLWFRPELFESLFWGCASYFL